MNSLNSIPPNSTSQIPRAIILFGILLAIGLILGAFILGVQTKNIGSGRSSVSVKGLAEKPVKADLAEWQVTATATGATFTEALSALRQEKIELDKFLEKQGFQKEARREGSENVEPRIVQKELNERTISVQEGFTARQSVVIVSKALDAIDSANKAALDFKASGHEIDFYSPSYLVSNLEEIKMSLISTATENAKKRAGEFIKHSDAELGSMRSAFQGAFYILPNTADANMDDYGGTYDKSTIDKIARVVVTVEFNLK